MSVIIKGVRCSESSDAWMVPSPASGSITIPKDGRWQFNGDFVEPTFSPSVNETWGKEGQTHEQLRADPAPNRNHCFIRSGHIEYLGDCTHSMAGQTVRIPAFDAHYPDGYEPGKPYSGGCRHIPQQET